MNVSELIALLTEMVENEEVSGETPVRLMYQPNYPFFSEVSGLATEEQIQYAEDEDEDEADPVARLNAVQSRPNVLYILEGTQIGYGNKTAWKIGKLGESR